MRLIVVSVGRLKAPFDDDIAHYKKLLSRYARLELVEVQRDEDVQGRVPPRAFVTLLDVAGQTMDTFKFANFVEQRRASGLDLCFVVGGPFGVPPLDRVDLSLSLGALTMPHQLARVVLLEQIYRAHKIIAGEPYHH